MAEVGVIVCANPTRARSFPTFRPFPVSFARLRSPLCHTVRHPADRSVRLLQPSLAGEVRTSMRLMARVRAARCGLSGGASSLQSDVVVAGGLRGRTLRVRSADRICASWRLLSEPEQEQHPGPARWATRRRHRVGQCARVRRVLGVRVSCVGNLYRSVSGRLELDKRSYGGRKGRAKGIGKGGDYVGDPATRGYPRERDDGIGQVSLPHLEC